MILICITRYFINEILCQRQGQQNYKENGHKIQGIHGQNKDIYKSFL